ncbi:ABC transporter permease subunit [Streptomyces cavernae]|uniref:ABC transporter permease subunit n=1 Tax=Streptomyces cavernae TaxID=2259034 RepID=UPI000FEBE886|nr:ABC transporter permease subunit [Streptomyces cavernae]
MSAPVRTAPYRSQLPPARDGFGQLLHAEWTKLRTVPRWGLVLLSAMVVTVLVSVLAVSGSSVGGGGPAAPVGPDGNAVKDTMQLVHERLPGDGSITARVSGLKGLKAPRPDGGRAGGPPAVNTGKTPGWTKAGIIIKANTKSGSSYAAVVLTHGHGVRMQWDYTHDLAGSATRPDEDRWLRLVRKGDVLTGYESADGKDWRRVGSVRPAGLTGTVEAGVFTAAAPNTKVERAFGGTSIAEGPGRATAHFDELAVNGGEGGRRQATIGRPAARDTVPAVDLASGSFELRGSGDVGPLQTDTDITRQTLSGAMIGLIPLSALGVLFITAEYRRGMIRTTLTASPRRGRLLAAKAIVLGGVTFVAGLIGAVLSFQLGEPIMRRNGHKPPRWPELSLTDGPVLRAVIGTAALLAVISVLALALGALLRHTAAAITLIVVMLVLPQILISGLPLGAAHALMRATPLAGFAIQDAIARYDHAAAVCLPEEGCYPQGPWAGFAVLCVYAAAALGLAIWRLRRRDV